ncbi:MAG: aconitate hydratase [Sphaerochaetaceae bacterium]|nr:aconitate hydratase [Sphaerochaetaceae bacterium]
MRNTVTYKILKEHLAEGNLEKGQSISIKIDQTLTQDATGTMAYLEFESLGLDKVRNELAVSYIDHNTVQVGFENADDHKYLQSIALSKGIVLSRPGNGICHQVHIERFGVPGKTLLGSDSHTPTGGGIGMLAIGAGGLDVALAMAGVPYSVVCPEVIEIRLTGKLRSFCSAKDVILTVLEHFGVKGNVNKVFEYTGSGVASLSVTDRATICNMGTECGVTSSIFPSDSVTEKYLISQGRGKDFRLIAADENAEYDGLFEIDLSKIVPMAACPHSPGNVKKVSELAGLKVSQVLIGSCTNSSYTDLYMASKILEGKTVSENLSLGVAPGSRHVLSEITKDGTLLRFIKSGARILESACGFCIGNSCSPPSNGVSLRTNNRNFEGRSGTKDGQVYLVSPETAAISAVTGVITDPTSLACDEFEVPVASIKNYDDSMFIFPVENPAQTDIEGIFRGPNIGNPPVCPELSEKLCGNVVIKLGDKVTTDHIMPAGQRLKYRSNIPLYSTFVFEGVDSSFSKRCIENRDCGKANFIVAGASYGQGSSREHAAICPMFLGVRAVFAVSIERIHQANLCNFGILPLTFKNLSDYEKIDSSDILEISDVPSQIKAGSSITVNNISKNYAFEMSLDVSPMQREMLLCGGRLNQIKSSL